MSSSDPPPAFYPKHLAAARNRKIDSGGSHHQKLQHRYLHNDNSIINSNNQYFEIEPNSRPSVAFDGLPQAFIQSMRKLFDILDTNKKGLVRLDDLSQRWDGALIGQQVNGDLPNGVIQHLKKVTNPQGFLTFERFCAGLKIAIMRHEAETTKLRQLKLNTSSNDQDTKVPSQFKENAAPNECQNSLIGNNYLLHHVDDNPHDMNESSRTISSSCSPNSTTNSSSLMSTSSTSIGISDLKNNTFSQNSPAPLETSLGINKINEPPPKPPRDPIIMKSISKESLLNRRPLQENNYENYQDLTANTNENGIKDLKIKPRRVKRHNSHTRRHTLTGGLDFSMLKRMQHCEEEKLVLEEGLNAIQNAQDWYQERLRKVENRLNLDSDYQSMMGSSMGSKEETQEKMIFELGGIKELNQRLSCLVTSELTGGFPSHMNLEVPKLNSLASSSTYLEQERTIQRLKEQNRLLTEEVSRKCNMISVLQHEKKSIIKQLFTSRAIVNQLAHQHQQNRTQFDDEHTFM